MCNNPVFGDSVAATVCRTRQRKALTKRWFPARREAKSGLRRHTLPTHEPTLPAAAAVYRIETQLFTDRLQRASSDARLWQLRVVSVSRVLALTERRVSYERQFTRATASPSGHEQLIASATELRE